VADAKKPARKTQASARATSSSGRAKTRASGKSGSSGASGTTRKKSSTQPKKSPPEICFVISPFGGWHDDYHRDIFCPAIKQAGLEPARADDLFRSSNIVHDIWHLVATARVLLADLTGKNPNVFYELGLAHAARKPVLLLTQSMDDVPFDLRALRVITYDVEHPAWGDVLRDNIKQGLKEMLESPERSVLPTFLLEEPGKQPKVTEEEARLIGLQQQVDGLRSELRASSRPSGRRSRIDADEARTEIARLVQLDAPDRVIVELLTDKGAPNKWVRDRIAELR
jgi:hypothetical protein